MNIKQLETKARNIRTNIIKTIHHAGSGHPAGSLGMADIFTVLYFDFLKINPKKPNDPKRDYLILSNGHICPALYAAMAEKGYIKKQELMTLRKFGSRLQGHPHRKELPGLETSSGPLGSGLSQGVGIALGLKLDKKQNRVICLTSDGEHDEGNTWEAVMLAGKYKLDNLVQIIDRNKIQIDGPTNIVLPLNSLKAKYKAFGWIVQEINGNDIDEIKEALKKTDLQRRQPKVIIANTTPGKGVSFMEHKYQWHGKAPNDLETEHALKELNKK